MADALVIGAGLIGACVARLLAEAGRSVTVMTAQGVADGATRRAVGVAMADPQRSERSEPGLRELLDWATRLRVPFREVAARWLPREGAVRLDDPAERVEQRPAALIDLVALSVRLLNHPAISLRQRIEARGLSRVGAQPLSPLEAVVSGERLLGDRVILATNAYAGLISPYLADAITLARGAVWVSRPLDPGELPALSQPVVVGHGRILAAQHADGRARVGAWRWEGTGEDPDDVTRRFIKHNFPEALDEIAYRQTGVTSVSRDGEPLVGQLPGEIGVLYALAAGPFGAAWAMPMAHRVLGLW